jgi:glycerol-3-phosphate dehydrogenase (NAD(P)+)
VIGAGSFGTAVANILAEKSDVILYVRRPEKAEMIRQSRVSSNQKLNDNIEVTNDLPQVADQCTVLFPVIPSANFRDLIKTLSPYLYPSHILIHGTKGLDYNKTKVEGGEKILREDVKTMSQVIRDESDVVRIGCMAGPNLAKELSDQQPAATVIASHYQEVIEVGKRLLRTDFFQVYGSFDLLGVEWCGVLKNIIAIAAGGLAGLGFGENARSLLVSRGLVEVIAIGKYMGGRVDSFVGLAGVGDLVATTASSLSRNFTVGYKLASGQKLDEIIDSMDEVAEGINTIKIVKNLIRTSGFRAPITEKLYEVLFEDLPVQEALQFLMKYPGSIDVDLSQLDPQT